MTIAAELARNVCRYRYEDLPAKAVDHACMIVASTIASAAAGKDIRSARVVRELVKEQGGTPEASIWFDNDSKIPAVNACRANALASDAAASDDSDLRTIAHLGTQLTAASIAMGERTGASGKDVLAAIVLGYEVAGRMAASIMPSYRDLGFHGSLCVIFASAVAAGRILNLNEPQMTQAIAMSAVSMGGLHTAADSSEAREYFAGNAALGGVNAAYAAQKGYVVEERVLETRKGFFEVYGAKGADVESVIRDWGKDWDIVTDMAIKLVPGGHTHHALGEAAAQASRAANVLPEQIRSIVVSQPVNQKLRVGPMRATRKPKNLVEVAHTPAYFVAAAVADRNFSWVHATEARYNDPVIHSLIDKIKVGNPVPDPDNQFRHGGVVTVETNDGRNYIGTVHTPRGAGALGIDWADVDEKFNTLVPASGLGKQNIENALKLIHEFRQVEQVSRLTELLRCG